MLGFSLVSARLEYCSISGQGLKISSAAVKDMRADAKLERQRTKSPRTRRNFLKQGLKLLNWKCEKLSQYFEKVMSPVCKNFAFVVQI